MPTLRAYRETDWEAFLALDLETGDATLRHETEEARARFRERWLDHLERAYVTGLLQRHQWNVSAVAQAAGLDRTYVHRLIRKHDLERGA